MESADYIALRELSLSFDVPDGWVRPVRFRNTSLRLSGRNLKLWTRFPGVDPQTNWRGNVSVGGSADFDSQPIPRIFLLTVRTSF